MIISCLLAISRVYLARESQEKEIIKSALLTMIFPNGIIVISDLNEWETDNHKDIEWKSVIFHLFEYNGNEKTHCFENFKEVCEAKENFSQLFLQNFYYEKIQLDSFKLKFECYSVTLTLFYFHIPVHLIEFGCLRPL